MMPATCKDCDRTEGPGDLIFIGDSQPDATGKMVCTHQCQPCFFASATPKPVPTPAPLPEPEPEPLPVPALKPREERGMALAAAGAVARFDKACNAWLVESSSKPRPYLVRVSRKGRWSCECPATVEDCRHVYAVRHSLLAGDGLTEFGVLLAAWTLGRSLYDWHHYTLAVPGANTVLRVLKPDFALAPVYAVGSDPATGEMWIASRAKPHRQDEVATEQFIETVRRLAPVSAAPTSPAPQTAAA